MIVSYILQSFHSFDVHFEVFVEELWDDALTDPQILLVVSWSSIWIPSTSRKVQQGLSKQTQLDGCVKTTIFYLFLSIVLCT